jgi:hypothetical protein
MKAMIREVKWDWPSMSLLRKYPKMDEAKSSDMKLTPIPKL